MGDLGTKLVLYMYASIFAYVHFVLSLLQVIKEGVVNDIIKRVGSQADSYKQGQRPLVHNVHTYSIHVQISSVLTCGVSAGVFE